VRLTGLIGWLAWGLLHIAFLTGLENRISTVATWLAATARTRRTDRTFILGTTTSPDHPYLWMNTAHPGMIQSADGSATPTAGPG
jgi:NADH dehydrogenase